MRAINSSCVYISITGNASVTAESLDTEPCNNSAGISAFCAGLPAGIPPCCLSGDSGIDNGATSKGLGPAGAFPARLLPLGAILRASLIDCDIRWPDETVGFSGGAAVSRPEKIAVLGGI